MSGFKRACACAVAAASLAAALPAVAASPGDAGRFGTWTGYEVGRFPTSVVATDRNRDGHPDAVWGRHDFFENTVSVQLNLGDGTLGPVESLPTTESTTDVDAGDLNGDGA